MKPLLSRSEQSDILYQAVKSQDIKAVRENAVSFHEFFDKNSLRQSVMDGNIEILKLLIEMGAYIPGGNLIVVAAAFEHWEMCEFLVSLGESSEVLINYDGGYVIKEEFSNWARDKKLALQEKNSLTSAISAVDKTNNLYKI